MPIVIIARACALAAGPSGGDGPTFLDQVTHNGVFAALAGLTVTLPIFLPLAVAIVAGDTIAGEANLGTLRYLLVRPAGRTRLLAVKAVTVAVFCLAATFVVAVAGLVAGVAPLPDRAGHDAVGRHAVAGDRHGAHRRRRRARRRCRCSAWPPSACSSRRSPTCRSARWRPRSASFILSGVLDAVPQVSAPSTRGCSPTTGCRSATCCAPRRVGRHRQNLGLQLLYVAVFGSLAWARFTTKDVLA